jgi:hypothetical protein
LSSRPSIDKIIEGFRELRRDAEKPIDELHDDLRSGLIASIGSCIDLLRFGDFDRMVEKWTIEARMKALISAAVIPVGQRQEINTYGHMLIEATLELSTEMKMERENEMRH